MHEMGIASSIFDLVEKEAAKRAPARLSRVGLVIGEWAGVDSESLRFCFETIVRGSELDPLALDIDVRTRHNYCRTCTKSFPLEMFEIRCPECGGVDTEPSGGAELEIAYLELDECNESLSKKRY